MGNCIRMKKNHIEDDSTGALSFHVSTVNDSEWSEFYHFVEFIGEGSMGQISLVIKMSNQSEFALKTIQLSRVFDLKLVDEMKNEIQILKNHIIVTLILLQLTSGTERPSTSHQT